jgi:hypothetical protein
LNYFDKELMKERKLFSKGEEEKVTGDQYDLV